MLVKHAAPLAPLTAEQAALDTWKRGGADALIVSGSGTGAPVSATLLDSVQRAVRAEVPIYIGSGLTLENLTELAPLASGAIVGTALKVNGELSAPVDPRRVRAMRDALDQVWA
jgi:predicted TIM-barrel enzyme